MSGLSKRTVKAMLRNVVKEWIESIENERLRKALERDTIVCGGSIASMLLGERANDYDIYFKTLETTANVARYYAHVFNTNHTFLKTAVTSSCNPEVVMENTRNIRGEVETRVKFKIQSAGVAAEGQSTYNYFETVAASETDAFISSLDVKEEDIDEVGEYTYSAALDNKAETAKDTIALCRSKAEYRPVFFSDNALSLTNRIQLVIRFYGTPDEIYKNYDFVHTMNSYDYSTDELRIHEEALDAILAKQLIYKGSLYPVASIFRTRKFLNRGWKISAGQLLKILLQISSINLRDPAVLRDQLIGVDRAYMSQLLRFIEADKGVKVDDAYIAQLIDKVFEE